jgi:hypothetical protein
MTRQNQSRLGRIYDVVESALWTTLITALAAFAAFVAPGLPAVMQRNEAERLAGFERRTDFYCTKWGFQPNTGRYSTCVSDLHQFRDSLLEEQAADSF